jgi:hypothetical protein
VAECSRYACVSTPSGAAAKRQLVELEETVKGLRKRLFEARDQRARAHALLERVQKFLELYGDGVEDAIDGEQLVDEIDELFRTDSDSPEGSR